MEAQLISPVKAPSALRHESAARGLSDVFQAILRDRETRGMSERHEAARTLAARPGFGLDDSRPPIESHRPDAASETRERDRGTDPRDDWPDTRDLEAADPPGRSDDLDDPRPGAELSASDRDAGPVQDGIDASRGTTRTADAPDHAPDEASGSEPRPEDPDTLSLADPPVAPVAPNHPAAAALEPASAPASAPASPPATASAPRPAMATDSAVAGPQVALGDPAAAPAAAKSEASSLPPQAVVNATQNDPPPGQAVALALAETPNGKRPGATGYRASALAPLAESGQEPANPDAASRAAAKSLIAPSRQPHDNAAKLDGADKAGHKAGSPLAKTPAAQAGQADINQTARANPAIIASTLEEQGLRAPAAADSKAAATSGPASQAQTGLTAIDPMRGATFAPTGRPASTPAADRPATLNDVVVQIQRAAGRGEDRIRIRLHPAELGQVDVRLKVGADGIVRASVQVDRPETLDFMQRDARGLERALQDAGLKTDSGSLSFTLRDNGEGRPEERPGEYPEEHPDTGGADSPAITHEDGQPNTEIPAHAVWSGRALDIRV